MDDSAVNPHHPADGSPDPASPTEISAGVPALRGQGAEGDARAALARREMLLRAALGVAAAGSLPALLAGCASNQRSRTLPDPDWPELDEPIARRPSRQPDWRPSETPGVSVIPRAQWAKGQPIPARMDRMQPVNKITLHHTAIPASNIRTRGDAARMIEQIRQSHVNRSGEPFGDIGYHYVVDPQGNVWEGRPLAWQGAHVAKQNPGNLGIVCLGNFEQHRPTEQQVRAMSVFVRSQMARFKVPANRVYTHRELASTACPGRNMQPLIANSRSRGFA